MSSGLRAQDANMQTRSSPAEEIWSPAVSPAYYCPPGGAQDQSVCAPLRRLLSDGTPGVSRRMMSSTQNMFLKPWTCLQGNSHNGTCPGWTGFMLSAAKVWVLRWSSACTMCSVAALCLPGVCPCRPYRSYFHREQKQVQLKHPDGGRTGTDRKVFLGAIWAPTAQSRAEQSWSNIISDGKLSITYSLRTVNSHLDLWRTVPLNNT